MTNAAWNPTSPFDFTPSATQDRDLVQQLSFVPGLKEIVMLRQVHALEHATVWVLSNQTPPNTEDNALGGMSTDEGFYLYGNVNPAQLRRAVHTALERITSGEWNLAVHPRCGTNLSVGMLLAAGVAVGTHLILPKGPIEQLLALGVAATAATQLAPDLGILAQRYITTAIPFNLEIAEIAATQDLWSRSAHFVRVRWRE
ncbi:MAG: hypothetical protein F6K32_21275 [Desertifilum sp. SIO1I2]|nr:hypothetical protein [Desertifilum sp. SIO1I2]